ncbi:MAG: GTP-binding protein [Promethearchaeota archaeon]|nr:MAG: GTP-binding protein [Candidatus Lokiarchaeota archaeon]
MPRVNEIDELLGNLLRQVNNLSAALVVDLDGLIIARSSVQGFDEELIGAIMAILDQTITKIKRYAETSFGTGTFDTNDFQLFYMELGNKVPAIFVLVANHYSNIDKFIPFAYIVAEKISSILSNYDVSLKIPKLTEEGELILPAEEFNRNNVKKIALVGSEAVGKSKLAQMYCGGNFNENRLYKPTLGISINEKELQVSSNFKLTLYLLDLSGLKSFVKIRKFYYKYSNAVLILFDYSNIDTLNNISGWIEESRHFLRNETIPLILIGNKIDKIENREEIKSQASKLANQYNISFFETSALTGEGIDELFTYLISSLF